MWSGGRERGQGGVGSTGGMEECGVGMQGAGEWWVHRGNEGVWSGRQGWGLVLRCGGSLGH